MNSLHDLMAKLAKIEEAAKFSDIPAVQRKKQATDATAKDGLPRNWKVTGQDLDDEEHEGKISHPKTLAKNSGRTNESGELEADVAPGEAVTINPDDATGGGGAGAADESIEECGDMPMAQGQEGGKVELSMNDLLKLIAQMSKGQDPNVGHGDQPLLGDEYENEPNTSVAPASAVTPTGDDLFSKGGEAEKVNGGGNPLQAQLAELYAQIKEAQVNELSTQTLSSYVKKRGAQLSGGYEDKDKVKGLNAALRKVKQNSAKQNAAPTLKEANQIVRKLRK